MANGYAGAAGPSTCVEPDPGEPPRHVLWGGVDGDSSSSLGRRERSKLKNRPFIPNNVEHRSGSEDVTNSDVVSSRSSAGESLSQDKNAASRPPWKPTADRADRARLDHHILFASSPSLSSRSGFDDLGEDSSGAIEAATGSAVQSAPGMSPGLPSIGAALHESAQCTPCLFSRSEVGCANGDACSFCHLSHKRSTHPRPNKGKRDRYKKLISRQSELAVQDDEDQADAPTSAPPPPLKSKLQL